MRKFVLLLFIALSNLAFAQQLNTSSNLLKSLEQPDSVTHARVVAVNHVNVALVSPDTLIDGYRIRIFFDNSQQARSEFIVQQQKYDSLYPQDNIYVEYVAPYFKLSVCDFVNYEEALIKWSSVVKEFKSAFIVPEKINIKEFKTPIPVVDSLISDSINIELNNLSLSNLSDAEIYKN